ncbi:MAG: heme lyase CcmF/NrfE family subunit [Steroidobacteraceae bacterium]
MWVELGHLALILALLLAGAQAFLGLAGAHRQRERWLAATHSAVAGQFVMVGFAVGTLIHAFVSSDFSVKYVAENSNSALPLFYRVAALWGAHEGSLLLWIVILSLWTVAVAARGRQLTPAFHARVLGVLGIVSFGFLAFTLLTSNPFVRIIPAAADGNDLNPLLQDFALAVHPPILYTGYVGCAVAFAFACAALIEGGQGQQWARWMRPWTVMSWAFLSCGIALGSWWAYYELGWGGWWFWDPVENASFMPWLIATALIHSLAVTDKRGLFKSWTLLLAVAAFSLSLLGTFLVRSGVLVSVHSFAADPRRGIFILAFLIVMIGGALTLYAWRAPYLKSNAGFEMLSREAFLLFNNILLVVACAVVFGGTLAPLIADTLGLGTLSVGTPYFNPSFMVPMLPMLGLLAIGMHARWRRGALGESRRRILGALALAAVLGGALALGVYANRTVLSVTGAVLALWIIGCSLIDPIDRLRRSLSLPASIVGMSLAHIGLGLFVLGVTFVQSNTIERDVALKQGQSAQLGSYRFEYLGGADIGGPNYEGFRGAVQVYRGNQLVTTLEPEKRRYLVQGSVMTEAAIQPRWNRDLFAALGEDVGAGAWSLRLQYRPLIRFIWFGALIMAIGGVCTLFDRRYRVRQEQSLGAPIAAGSGTVPAGAGDPGAGRS